MNYWLDQLEMWTNGFDYIIARDKEDAIEICHKHFKYDFDELECDDWYALSNDEIVDYMVGKFNDIERDSPAWWLIATWGRGYFYHNWEERIK